jgi:hypothetical protein
MDDDTPEPYDPRLSADAEEAQALEKFRAAITKRYEAAARRKFHESAAVRAHVDHMVARANVEMAQMALDEIDARRRTV